MTHVTCRLTAKNRDQLRNPTLGSRVLATFVKGPHCSHAVRKCGPFLHVLCSAICVCVLGKRANQSRHRLWGHFCGPKERCVRWGPDLSSEKTLWGGIRLVSNPKWGAKLEAITTKVGVCIGDAVFSESNFYLLKTRHI